MILLTRPMDASILLPESNGSQELFALITGGYMAGVNQVTPWCLNSNLWNETYPQGFKETKVYKDLFGWKTM